MARVRCPHCGVLYTLEDRKTYTFESSRKLPNMAMAPPMQAPAGPPSGLVSARRETPTYLPSRETHLDLPLAQAYAFGRFVAPIGFVIGCGIGFVAAVLTDVVMAGVRDTNLTGWGYLGVIGLFGIGGGVIAFFWEAKMKFPERLGLYDGLLWKTEEATGRDIDGDGHVGEPPAEVKEPEVVRVEFIENGVPRVIADIEGVGVDRLKKLAELVRGGKGFSERTAGEAKITQKEFGKLRDYFVAQGWAKWKNDEPRQGVELLRHGVRLFETLSPTLPLVIGGLKNEGTSSSSSKQQGSGNLSQRYVPIEE